MSNLQVIYDKFSGKSRGFGFVTMSTVEEVRAAAQQFNGYVNVHSLCFYVFMQVYISPGLVEEHRVPLESILISFSLWYLLNLKFSC